MKKRDHRVKVIALGRQIIADAVQVQPFYSTSPRRAIAFAVATKFVVVRNSSEPSTTGGTE